MAVFLLPHLKLCHNPFIPPYTQLFIIKPLFFLCYVLIFKIMQSEMFAMHAMTANEEVEVKDQRSNFGLYTPEN
jgi:hypothetical protein